MTVQEVLQKSITFFKDKKFESARLDAELLISAALSCRRIDLYLKFDQPLDETEVSRCREFVRRRSLGEPVAYILGEKDFFGHSFKVDQRVLIPRPETELLVEAALKQFAGREGSIEAMDLGTGSGCLGLSLAKQNQSIKATLVEKSEGALAVAHANAENLGLLDRITLKLADAGETIFGEFDLIVANPPYIARTDPRVQESVVKFEPATALFADQEGFALIEAWAKKAHEQLKPGGWMGFEFGIDQAEKCETLFKTLGLTDVKIIFDLSGLPRHVIGLKGN